MRSVFFWRVLIASILVLLLANIVSLAAYTYVGKNTYISIEMDKLEPEAEITRQIYEEYKNGVFAKTTISVKAGDQTKIAFHREGSYEDTVERITLKLVSKKKGAFWATVDGKPVTRYIVRDAWEEAESGWYYNLSDRTIWLKTPKPKKNDFDIVISTEKFDLIGMAED